MEREAVQQPSILEIWETANEFAYRILEPSDLMGMTGPVVTESTVRVSRPTVTALCGRMRKLAHAPTSREEIRACGRALFDQLIGALDEAARDRLSACATPLVISTRESDVVWELLHDGDDFWGLKFAVARQVRAGVRPPALPLKPTPNRCLVVANPSCDEGLEGLEHQAQSLIRHLQDLGVQCRYLARDQATPEEVLLELSSGSCDIFHYSGHVARVTEDGQPMADGTGEYALQLAGGWLRSYEIARAAHGVGVAFINGCQSAATVESMASAFLRRGSALVIGTTYRVSAHGAGLFAENFYRAALGGEQVGEAFRTARRAVRADDSSHNAWMCFIMYGNPCLRIIDSPLPTALRAPYDDGCRRVIEDCVRLSRPYGVVCTPFLFAAMLNGSDPGLRNWLSRQNVSGEDLRRLFDSARSSAQEGKEPDVSGSVAEIVRLAEREIRQQGRARIAESDLIAAFAVHGGGTMGRLLREAGVDLSELAHVDGVEFGPLTVRDCTDEAWSVITRAGEIAAKTNVDQTSSVHLFVALLECTQTGLAARLRAGGIDPALLGNSLLSGPATASADRRPEPSPTVRRALQHAIEIAAGEGRELIGPEDLMAGLVKSGGGSIGRNLRRYGFDLGGADAGDQSWFDDRGTAILAEARLCAQTLGWNTVATPHLVIALCSMSGIMADLIRDQGADPGEIVRTLGRAFRAGQAAGRPRSMTARLGRIVEIAGRLSTEAGDGAIGERHLVAALVEEGGGETADVLRLLGVDLSAQKPVCVVPTGTLLDRLGEDLTSCARAGRLRTVIGRDAAIDHLLGILAGGPGVFPVLVGEPGVGKTAIVHGLAQRVAAGETDRFNRFGVIGLRVSDLCEPGGDHAAVIARLAAEVEDTRIILFVDDLTGVDGDNRSLPAELIRRLVRSGILCIGAARPADYEAVAAEADLEGVLQPIPVSELTVEATAEILAGLSAHHEASTGILITDAGLRTVTELAQGRPDMWLPGAAIELLERAVSVVRSLPAPEPVGADHVTRAAKEINTGHEGDHDGTG